MTVASYVMFTFNGEVIIQAGIQHHSAHALRSHSALPAVMSSRLNNARIRCRCSISLGHAYASQLRFNLGLNNEHEYVGDEVLQVELMGFM